MLNSHRQQVAQHLPPDAAERFIQQTEHLVDETVDPTASVKCLNLYWQQVLNSLKWPVQVELLALEYAPTDVDAWVESFYTNILPVVFKLNLPN